MNVLRRLPTRQLLTAIGAAVAVVIAISAGAIAAIGGGPVPPARPLDAVIKGALDATPVAGISARISFVNHLVDSGSLGAGDGNALLNGADGRLWATADGRLRIELFSSRGDTQLAIDRRARRFSFYDSSSNTAYAGTLPAQAAGEHDGGHGRQTPTLKSIDDALAHLTPHADVGAPTPTDIAHQAAYSVRITPKAGSGGLLGGAQLAWDATHGVPLDVAIYSRTDSSPVLEIKVTRISFGALPASDLRIGIPTGATINRVGAASGERWHAASMPSDRFARTRRPASSSLQGARAVRAALPFALDAPAALDGLKRSSVRELTLNGRPAALLTYGERLGTVAVLERTAAAAGNRLAPHAAGAAGGADRRALSLPTATVNGARASVLPTALGTLVSFERGGIAFTIAGSVSRGAALAIANGL